MRSRISGTNAANGKVVRVDLGILPGDRVFAFCRIQWKLHYIRAPPRLFWRETTFRQKQYQTQGRDFPHDRFDAVLAKLGDPILPKTVLNLGRGVRCVQISRSVFSGFFVFQHETQERDFPLGPSLAPKMEPALKFSIKHRSAISRTRFCEIRGAARAGAPGSYP